MSYLTNMRRTVIIRKLSESKYENLRIKVCNRFKGGLRLDVDIETTERKVSRNVAVPGVGVVKPKHESDKDLILQNKSELHNKPQYRKMFIHNDKSRTERLVSANVRLLVNIRGSRVVTSSDRFHVSDNHGSCL